MGTEVPLGWNKNNRIKGNHSSERAARGLKCTPWSLGADRQCHLDLAWCVLDSGQEMGFWLPCECRQDQKATSWPSWWSRVTLPSGHCIGVALLCACGLHPNHISPDPHAESLHSPGHACSSRRSFMLWESSPHLLLLFLIPPPSPPPQLCPWVLFPAQPVHCLAQSNQFIIFRNVTGKESHDGYVYLCLKEIPSVVTREGTWNFHKDRGCSN